MTIAYARVRLIIPSMSYSPVLQDPHPDAHRHRDQAEAENGRHDLPGPGGAVGCGAQRD
jgi:hypothetical protein